MTREIVTLSITDLSDFAKRLRADLLRSTDFPGHLSLINMLARAAGYSNYQHLKAAPLMAAVDDPPPPNLVDLKRIERALRHFDDRARLARWPSRTGLQTLCLWVLWSQLPGRQTLTEPEINRRIDDLHLFGDRAILRRTLIGLGLFERSADGRAYRRIEQSPPVEALALLRALSDRQK